MSEVCKYRLPCGWCELKNKECELYVYPNNYKPDPYVPPKDYPMVSVYAAPGYPPSSITYGVSTNDKT